MNIRWIGQSGYILRGKSTEIMIDPYLSDIVNKVANRPRLVPSPISPREIQVDAVVCTHDHLDHLDPDAIADMDKERIQFIAPSSCVPHLQELGCKRIQVLDVGQSVEIGNFQLTGVFAAHSVPAIGLMVTLNDITLYFTGDTLYDERLEGISTFCPDVMFVCINGRLGNMDVNEAVKLTGIIQPKLAIPTHYGMFKSNTEDPQKYVGNVDNGFEMEFNKEYTISKLGEKVICSVI